MDWHSPIAAHVAQLSLVSSHAPRFLVRVRVRARAKVRVRVRVRVRCPRTRCASW